MTYHERHVVNVTTAANGAASVASDLLTGRVLAISYVPDGSVPFANGVGFVVSVESTGEQVWSQTPVNAAATVYPRVAVHGTDGAAALFAAGGTALREPIAAAQDRLVFAITGGGNAKKGKFIIVVG